MDVMPLLLLVAGSAAVAGLARRTPVPAPLLLVAVGLALSYLPGVPDYTLDPEVVLPLLLPPLLYTSATESSYLDLRAQKRAIALLSVGYVLFATVVVGLAAYALVPGLPLTAALVLGAVVAPPDAVAATAVARRVGLPPGSPRSSRASPSSTTPPRSPPTRSPSPPRSARAPPGPTASRSSSSRPSAASPSDWCSWRPCTGCAPA
ncbi:hypothetical protein GCM10020256_23870 [Streptomyces thermocoprophilus]